MVDWGIIGTAVLGGGIVGQVFTIFATDILVERRENKKWMLSERHKAIVEILDVLTSNPTGDELKNWTHKIRNSSLKIHILYENGTAPTELSDALEFVFQIARRKKNGDDSETCSAEFRASVSDLRKKLSKYISKK